MPSPDDREGRGEGTGRRPSAPRWWVGYAARLLLTDAAAIYVAVFTAYVVRFDADGSAAVGGQLSPSYLLVSVVLMWVWLAALVMGRTEDRRIVGSGPAEYQRVFSVTWKVFAAVAIIAYLLRMEIGRGYLAIAFPLGTVLLLLGRFGWRQWLHRRRIRGLMRSRVVVVGEGARIEELVGELGRRALAGFSLVGACVPGGAAARAEIAGVPVVGSVEDAAQAARRLGADTVAVAGSDAVTAEVVRRLGWDLEGSGIDLALAMALTDIAGPRVIMQPVSGLPLVYVDEPRFVGPRYVLKTVADWLTALVITVLLSPVLLIIALAVRASGPGPVLYHQDRVGTRGTTFPMLKFRTMVADAHERLAEVLAAEGVDSVAPFYKPKNDPRVTRVGRVLRKFSLDELPQLINVLRGQMSLVGPRPQIAAEVEQYDRRAHRRLLVKPGMTGLWQTSGRSSLTPEEGIRMDVYYVENWSLFGDFMILARTARVVLRGAGAY
jgi:exopolysaccharide biosynthesis polyprenyl glycosylphosphotransferase